jgi:hypothetical protein
MYLRHSAYPVALSFINATISFESGCILMDSMLDAHSFCNCDGVACRHRLQSSLVQVT